ncbi:MAG: tetratricopeptide repeat protein [Microcystis aeruginosa Ma_SC_T_19800800_S464]|jgi:tetratricopeptide (TPR) repeat protein|uniref:Tetratricopeptide repeat protein n=1 Tax=Microcystis aeruginosa Ma_SC_T_19800800_S464 TaxID=2486257 RepID=A0A552DY70_MICAE|nr:MAG: tetratricopeptide repeat protein [Microcystis aeruginosa Ma_SC_T_19800800_S464]
MKASLSNRRWLSIGLVLMLFALLSFSIMPLLTSILQSQHSSGQSHLSAVEQEKLASQALGYQMVLEREPDNQAALRGLLDTRLQQGDLRQAIEPLEKLAQLNPQQSDYLLLLAEAKQQIEDYAGATGSYRALLASHPQELRALTGLTNLFLSQNRSIEAISLVKETLDRALKAAADPNNPASLIDIVSVQLLLGKIYFEQQNYPEALNAYKQAQQMDVNDFRPILSTAIVLKEQGKNQEAQPLFQKALSLAPFAYRQEIQTLADENNKIQATAPNP